MRQRSRIRICRLSDSDAASRARAGSLLCNTGVSLDARACEPPLPLELVFFCRVGADLFLNSIIRATVNAKHFLRLTEVDLAVLVCRRCLARLGSVLRRDLLSKVFDDRWIFANVFSRFPHHVLCERVFAKFPNRISLHTHNATNDELASASAAPTC